MNDVATGPNRHIGLRFNVPAEYALATSQLFQTGGISIERKDGFVEPPQNLSIPKDSKLAAAGQFTFATFLATLNQYALSAVDLRDDVIVQTPADWGDLGTLVGALAGQVFRTGKPIAINFSQRADAADQTIYQQRKPDSE